MVGAFAVEDVLPMLTRYVGSLPSAKTANSRFKDVGISFPAKIERARVEKGKEPKSQTVVSYFADPPIEENEQTRVEAVTEVLEIALRDILREELGETYSVSVGLSQLTPQRGGGHIDISFSASPDNVDKMIARVQQEVARLQSAGPTRGSDDASEGDGAPRARNLGQAERVLARPVAIVQAARPRSAAHPQPPSAHRRGHAGPSPRDVQEILPGRSLRRRDAGSRETWSLRDDSA